MIQPFVPRPEQEEAIQAVLRDRAHLSRAEGGSGKTLVGVEAALRSRAPVCLVVAPLNTLTGWRKTFARQSGDRVQLRQVTGTKVGKAALEDLALGTPGAYFIGWERFRTMSWAGFALDFVIADEVHRQQNRKSSTHRALLSTRHAGYKLALSATPSGNRIEGMWATITWLWWGNKELVPAFWSWVTKYLRTELDPYQGKKIKGEKNPGAIWSDLPSKSYFPSPFQETPIIHEIEVELTGYQRKVYDRFEKEAVVWLEENPLVAALPAVQALRLRQICLAMPSIRWEWRPLGRDEDENGREVEDRDGRLYVLAEEVYFEDDAKSSKADAMLDVLSDLHAETPVPVLIFTHSRKFATMFTLRLQEKGYRARQFVGGMSAEEREWKKANFGVEFEILVATIATIGEGTDGLQDVCHIEFWASLEDNRVFNTQAKWRLSRAGQKKTVQRYTFMAANTVETKQVGRLIADQAQLDESFTTETEKENDYAA